MEILMAQDPFNKYVLERPCQVVMFHRVVIAAIQIIKLILEKAIIIVQQTIVVVGIMIVVVVLPNLPPVRTSV
jgi:hypothetical protein